MVVWGVVAVAILTVLVLAVVVVALIRRLGRLGASARRLSEDLTPMLAEIQRESERARAGVERLSGGHPDAGR